MLMAFPAQELPANNVLIAALSCASRTLKAVRCATMCSARLVCHFIERSTRSLLERSTMRLGNGKPHKAEANRELLLFLLRDWRLASGHSNFLAQLKVAEYICLCYLRSRGEWGETVKDWFSARLRNHQS
jgi:hypothetical protein